MGLHSVDYLARNPDRILQNHEIAGALSVSANHLAKIHQRLVRSGLLVAVRGPAGGFKLAKPANEITLLSVVKAIESDFEPTKCLLGRQECLRSACILGELSARINNEVKSYLSHTTAADLAR